MHADKSFTSDQVFDGLVGSSIGKSTVYRILSDMLKEGKIKKISSQSSRKVSYQYIDCRGVSEHLHLKCKDCGIIIHLDEATSEMLKENIMAAGSFLLDGDELLFGRCEGCREERKVKL